MTSAASAAAENPSPPVARRGRWHLGVALGALALSAVLLIAFERRAEVYAAATAVMAIPGLVGWAAIRGRVAPRPLLILLWALGAAVALAISDGLAGPFAVFALAPALVGAVLGASGLWAGLMALVAAGLGQWGAAAIGWGLALEAGPPIAGDIRLWLTLAGVVGVGVAVALAPRTGPSITAPAAEPSGPPRLGAKTDAAVVARAARLERERDLAQAAQRQAEEALREAEEGRRAARAVLQVTVDGRDAAEQRVREAEAARDEAAAARDRARAELAEIAAALDAAEALRRNAEAGRNSADEAAAARVRFLANMSHELRTPLNAILGFSDIMRQRLFGPLSDKYGEYAELIHDSGRHLLDLINDILDMAKIEAGRYELIRERLDGREPIEAAIRLMQRQADEGGVRLRPVMPSAPVEIDADRRAIKQIVLNLLSNALKFTPPGGEVTVIAGPRDQTFELTVSDTGVGIAAADLERLGRPFEQAGDSDAKLQGTGLGLSLVKAMAALHGGSTIIESRLGEGTAVTVSLPVLANAPPLGAGDRQGATVIPLAR